jgi:deoxyribodipyrimidine photo-lyase
VEHLQHRIKKRNDQTSPDRSEAVLYVMMRDQRVADNHALLAAQQAALELKLPLIVQFNLLPQTGYRRREHYHFMLSGLESVFQQLQQLNITPVLTSGSAVLEIQSLVQQFTPAAIYFDFNPLRGPQAVQHTIATEADCPVYVVDTHNIVPVWQASLKQEYAARTIRPKIHRLIADYLVEPPSPQTHPYQFSPDLASLSFAAAKEMIQELPAAGITVATEAGETAAQQHLASFVDTKLSTYAEQRNDPAQDGLSGLSPYFHYGQLSSLRAILEIQKQLHNSGHQLAALGGDDPDQGLLAGANTFFEEAVVRKELSDNFCYYNQRYDSLAGAPEWAQQTLQKHQHDERDPHYTYAELEQAQTHDPAWNAAQRELTSTGKMHGYMRMYWAKKILEWSDTPAQALTSAIQLNDSYSIDGGDPNGYVGVMWSIAGVHDRGWTERDIFGKIRYMNYNGLQRKFDIAAYEQRFSGD